ncbi:MAG: endonuclease III [bacterium]|nr:endonuclease III [bacterium]
MAESQSKKKERALEIVELLRKEYPDSTTSLNYSNPLELLIATILSAQCTDDRVNKVTESLFGKYRKPEDYISMPFEELAEDIRSTGFFNNKTKSIMNCCQNLIDNFSGEVPDNMEDLVSLPGVGRKTANVILGNIYGIPGIIVDTHVKRLSLRMGFTEKKDPDKIEADLMKVIPEKDWTLYSHMLIDHGRKTCQARKPHCDDCFINRLCLSSEVPLKS